MLRSKPSVVEWQDAAEAEIGVEKMTTATKRPHYLGGPAKEGTGSFRRLLRNMRRAKEQGKELISMGTATKIKPSNKGPKVGRKRKPQSKEVSKSLKGRFGARLLALAETAQLDAAKLGAKIGKSEISVHLYFAGKVVPNLNDWPKIAKALGVTVRELLPE